MKANDALSITTLREQLYFVQYKAKVLFAAEMKSTKPSKRLFNIQTSGLS